MKIPQRLLPYPTANRLLELLLGAELVGVSALLLTAVGSPGGKTGLRGHVRSNVAVGRLPRRVWKSRATRLT